MVRSPVPSVTFGDAIVHRRMAAALHSGAIAPVTSQMTSAPVPWFNLPAGEGLAVGRSTDGPRRCEIVMHIRMTDAVSYCLA